LPKDLHGAMVILDFNMGIAGYRESKLTKFSRPVYLRNHDIRVCRPREMLLAKVCIMNGSGQNIPC